MTLSFHIFHCGFILCECVCRGGWVSFDQSAAWKQHNAANKVLVIYLANSSRSLELGNSPGFGKDM